MNEGASGAKAPHTESPTQDRGIAGMRAVGSRMATDVGIFAMLALLFGFWVVLVQALSRNVFPEFSGEEWLPRLFSVGVSCGLMAALMACLPGLDYIAYRAALERVQTVPGDSLRLARQFIAWRWVAQTAGGIVFLTLVLWFEPVKPWSAALALLGTAFFGAWVDASLARCRSADAFRAHHGELVALFVRSAGGFMLQNVLLLWLWIVAAQRFDVAPGWQTWLAGGAVVVALSAYRAILAVFVITPAWAAVRVHAALFFVAAIGTVFAPEILRVAGLAELPRVHLRLERRVACVVADHLQLRDSAGLHASCNGKALTDDAQGLVELQVDVVSRVGSAYVLTGPDELGAKKSGRCKAIHLQRIHDPEAEVLRCIDIARGAVHAVPR